jgi:hypothetical protein
MAKLPEKFLQRGWAASPPLALGGAVETAP